MIIGKCLYPKLHVPLVAKMMTEWEQVSYITVAHSFYFTFLHNCKNPGIEQDFPAGITCFWPNRKFLAGFKSFEMFDWATVKLPLSLFCWTTGWPVVMILSCCMTQEYLDCLSQVFINSRSITQPSQCLTAAVKTFKSMLAFCFRTNVGFLLIFLF